jgi:two-component system sensor histidine kinase KdpD
MRKTLITCIPAPSLLSYIHKKYITSLLPLPRFYMRGYGTLVPPGQNDRIVGNRNRVDQLVAVHRSLRGAVLPLVVSVLLVGGATICLLVATQIFALSPSIVPPVYLIPVIIAATRGGLIPALWTALICAVTADFFFYEPIYTLWIANPQEVVDLTLFLLVATVTGNLAGRLRKEADTSRQREIEVRELYAFSRRLAGCYATSDLYAAIQDFITNHLGRPVALIGSATEFDRNALHDSTVPDQVRRQANEILADGKFRTQLVVDPATDDAWLIRPLSSDAIQYGVIVVNLGNAENGIVEASRHQIESILGDVTETLDRLNIAKTIKNAKLRTEAEQLKDVLIGSVSHELRNPLATILGSASVLAGLPAIQRDDSLSALAQATHEEAARLNGYVQKLLHATRITAQGVRPNLSWLDPADIVNAAIAQRAQNLLQRIEVTLAPDLPLIEADAILIEQAFTELLENAAKYSPANAVIEVNARCEDEQVVLSVSDKGVGLTASEQSQLFRRSFRSERHGGAVPGSGLGLWIAHTFVTAGGGTLHAVSEGEGRGTTVSIHLRACHEEVPLVADCVND